MEHAPMSARRINELLLITTLVFALMSFVAMFFTEGLTSALMASGFLGFAVVTLEMLGLTTRMLNFLGKLFGRKEDE